MTVQEIVAAVDDFVQRVSSVPPIQLEGQTLEVKSWCGNPKELSEEVSEAAVCLANADGGLVIVGVLDKKTSPDCYKPCQHREVNPGWVQERVATLTKPPVICRAYSMQELLPQFKGKAEAALIVLDVPRTSSLELHKIHGVCYKRKNDQCPIEYSTSADDYTDRVLQDMPIEEAIDQRTLSSILGFAPDRLRY
jgi:ATP-dependent DNA helicase RecG